MRLINTSTHKFEEFVGGQIPKYAILSHTWDGQEVSFQDMNSQKALANLSKSNSPTPGWAKIRNACLTARGNSYSYIWIDTCCIDKSSSAELQEAINSMFSWYEKAAVCYVFLSDLEVKAFPKPDTRPRCRWFTRGWTLQELLAPQHIIFFNCHWGKIGSRFEFALDISAITRIPERYLMHRWWKNDARMQLDATSVSMRMSWAASRTTTRVEDLAYCLLGLFDISMPMLYGEGTKAFYRLQEEIFKKTDDPTILAQGYKTPVPGFMFELEPVTHNIWGWFNIRRPLASGPWEFGSAGDFVSRRITGFHRTTFSLSQKGLKLETPVLRGPIDGGVSYAVLGCGLPTRVNYSSIKPSDTVQFILLPLVRAAVVDPSSSDRDQEFIQWTGSSGEPRLISAESLHSRDLEWAAVYIRQLNSLPKILNLVSQAEAAIILSFSGSESSESIRVKSIYPARPRRPIARCHNPERHDFGFYRLATNMNVCEASPKSSWRPATSPWSTVCNPVSDIDMLLYPELLALVIEHPRADVAPILFTCSFHIAVEHWQSRDKQPVKLVGHAEHLNQDEVHTRSESVFFSILRDPQDVRRRMGVFDSLVPTEDSIRGTFKLSDGLDIVLDFIKI